MPNMNRVAAKFAMDARSDPRRIAVAYSQGEQQRRRANLAQPLGALALRAADCVARFAKGITIRCTSRLACHPAKPSARSCWV